MGGPRIHPVPKAIPHSYYVEPRRWKRGSILCGIALFLSSAIFARHFFFRRVPPFFISFTGLAKQKYSIIRCRMEAIWIQLELMHQPESYLAPKLTIISLLRLSSSLINFLPSNLHRAGLLY